MKFSKGLEAGTDSGSSRITLQEGLRWRSVWVGERAQGLTCLKLCLQRRHTGATWIQSEALMGTMEGTNASRPPQQLPIRMCYVLKVNQRSQLIARLLRGHSWETGCEKQIGT